VGLSLHLVADSRGLPAQKPASASDGYQVKRLTLGDQDVGVAVAGQVDKPQVRNRGCSGRAKRRRAEKGAQLASSVRLVKTSHRAFHLHQVYLPIAGEIEKLPAAA